LLDLLPWPRAGPAVHVLQARVQQVAVVAGCMRAAAGACTAPLLGRRQRRQVQHTDDG
jgi:hypothetical protein